MFDHYFFTLLSVVYLLCKDGLFEGQSIGKRIMGISVQSLSFESGKSQKCSFSASATRNLVFAVMVLVAPIPFLGTIVRFLGFIYVIIELYFMYTDDEGVRIGDIYAKTRVYPSQFKVVQTQFDEPS